VASTSPQTERTLTRRSFWRSRSRSWESNGITTVGDPSPQGRRSEQCIAPATCGGRPGARYTLGEELVADLAEERFARGFRMWFHSGVRTNPGLTPFTRTGASSMASARVMASIAPQTAAPTAQPACGRAPAMPWVRTIEPPDLTAVAACFTAASTGS